jgi:hypothetical protein
MNLQHFASEGGPLVINTLFSPHGQALSAHIPFERSFVLARKSYR